MCSDENELTVLSFFIITGVQGDMDKVFLQADFALYIPPNPRLQSLQSIQQIMNELNRSRQQRSTTAVTIGPVYTEHSSRNMQTIDVPQKRILKRRWKKSVFILRRP